MTTWILLGVGVLLTLGTALFVASEFSLVALDRHTVERAHESGDRRAKGVLTAITHLSTNLSGAQVGITITTLLFGFAVQDPLATVLTPVIAALPVPASSVGPVSVLLAMALAYAFSMLFGELVPKNLAIAAPMATAKVVAPLQHLFTVVFKPLIIVFNSTANLVLRLVGIEPQEELSAARSPAELESLVRHSAKAGTLDVATARLLSRTLRLADREAADVMTHRGAMICVEAEEPAQTLLELSRSSGHSRFPVIDGSEDDIVGVVQVRQAISVPRPERARTSVRSLMADVPRVPETVGLDSLLLELRDIGAQLAVVIDEYGGTSGLVTLEDVIEEIVGEVSDEHDEGEPERFVEDSARTWTVSGLMRPDEIARDLGVRLPESPDYDTLGGPMMDRLRRLPLVGDACEVDGVRLEVQALDGRRVDSVQLRLFDDSARVADAARIHAEDGEEAASHE